MHMPKIIALAAVVVAAAIAVTMAIAKRPEPPVEYNATAAAQYVLDVEIPDIDRKINAALVEVEDIMLMTRDPQVQKRLIKLHDTLSSIGVNLEDAKHQLESSIKK